MDSNRPSSLDLEDFFSKSELLRMADIEKLRHESVLRNYKQMKELGKQIYDDVFFFSAIFLFI